MMTPVCMLYMTTESKKRRNKDSLKYLMCVESKQNQNTHTQLHAAVTNNQIQPHLCGICICECVMEGRESTVTFNLILSVCLFVCVFI